MGRLAGLGAFLLVADATKKGVRLDSSFSLQLLRAETSGENDGVGACLMHPQCIVPAFCCAKRTWLGPTVDRTACRPWSPAAKMP